jgi:uncharacterized protein (DUF608 family)
MTWLTTPIPIYQLLILLTVYVLYKELIKLTLKALLKRIRRNDPPRQILEKSENLDT